MESAERAVKTRGMNTARTVKTRGMKYSPEPLISSGLLNYVKADVRNPLRYSVKRFFCLYCTP